MCKQTGYRVNGWQGQSNGGGIDLIGPKCSLNSKAGFIPFLVSVRYEKVRELVKKKSVNGAVGQAACIN